MEAYHLAGHTVALQVLGSSLPQGPLVAGRELRAGARRPFAVSRTGPWTALERRLVVVAAGTAAERELARRAGLPWRHVSNRCDGLEVCRRSIAEETGENPGDWIYLHWIRAVTRGRRVLMASWSEVVRAAGRLGPRSGVEEAGPCPTVSPTAVYVPSAHACRGTS